MVGIVGMWWGKTEKRWLSWFRGSEFEMKERRGRANLRLYSSPQASLSLNLPP